MQQQTFYIKDEKLQKKLQHFFKLTNANKSEFICDAITNHLEFKRKELLEQLSIDEKEQEA